MNSRKFKTRILIADDDPFYLNVAKAALEAAGHDVAVATDGAEAIAALKKDGFHGAIVDLTMPKADGIAVIDSARSSGPNVNTPIIVITGHDDAQAIERAYKSGATSFLTKPLNWVLFTPHINFVLRSAQIEAELRDATTAAAFLSEIKSQMMTALAREFQAPIKTIFGFAELVRKEVYGPLAPAMYRELVADMGAAAQKLNASFLTLLNFGNTLTEQLEVKSEPTRIWDVITQAIVSAEPNANRNGINLQSRINIPEDTTINADAVLLSQAIRSVLSNAIKLAPKGTSVEIEARIGDDGNLKFWTVDLGPAIPASLIAEISGTGVSKAQRAHDNETRDVGIMVAKILTEAHQGKLTVRSEATGGNIVALDLPKARLTTDVAKPAAALQAGVPDRLAAISQALAADPRVRLGRQEPPSQASPGERIPAPVLQSRPRL